MSENSTCSKSQKSRLAVFCNQCLQTGKVHQHPPLAVLPGGNTSAVDISDLSMGREVLASTHMKPSGEAILLTELEEPTGHGCTTTRKEIGLDSQREEGILTLPKATEVRS